MLLKIKINDDDDDDDGDEDDDDDDEYDDGDEDDDDDDEYDDGDEDDDDDDEYDDDDDDDDDEYDDGDEDDNDDDEYDDGDEDDDDDDDEYDDFVIHSQQFAGLDFLDLSVEFDTIHLFSGSLYCVWYQYLFIWNGYWWFSTVYFPISMILSFSVDGSYTTHFVNSSLFSTLFNKDEYFKM